MFVFTKSTSPQLTEYKMCGMPILKIKNTETSIKKYFLGIQFKCIHKSAEQINSSFYKYFSQLYPYEKATNVQVILNHIGEAVIYARTLPFWLKKDSIVVATFKSHSEIFKMFAPEQKVLLVDRKKYPVRLETSFSKNGQNFTAVLFDEKLREINDSHLSFWKNWEKYLNTDFTKLKFSKALISEQDRQNVQEKLRQKGLNQQNLVLFFPKAQSIDNMPPVFWKNLEKKLRQRGFEILYNSNEFSLAEIYVLAKKVKAIIGMRSGVFDMLCELKTPQFVIYGHNSYHNDLQPMYSLFNFPFASQNNIFEYNNLNENADKILDDILKHITKEGNNGL